ncbi:hypothetical protein ACHAXT_007331 [Thalassiosira profunda]
MGTAMKLLSLAPASLIAAIASSSSANEGDGEGARAQCSLYLAQSTIPHAGLGMFTGVPLERGQYVGFGDPAIPILDMDFHAGGSMQKEDYHWLISEYVWMAKEMGADMSSEADTTSAFSSGFGALPNCHFRLKNIGETPVMHDAAGIGRADVGAGAFTPYHNRSTYTLTSLEAGSELFVDYGINWFLSREADMGLVPVDSSYPPATKFVKAAERLVETISAESMRDDSMERAMVDLWAFVKQSPYKSRPLSAVPTEYSVAQRAFEVGIQQTELEQSIRSLDYLNEHGKCVDNIKSGASTIPHAGRGAFATKSISKGGYISISPLLHIPERQTLDMYADAFDSETGEELGERDFSKPTGHQLLRNYCFGHRSSTLLLCPYAPGVQFINHNEAPNAKFVWSEDPVFHNSSWLEEPVPFFDNVWSANLAIEYVAISDINEGDEIFIDYGAEWQGAWTKHVAQWQPPEGAESYMSPQQLTDDPSIVIPTQDEDGSMMGSINIWCWISPDSIAADHHTWKEGNDWENGIEYHVDKILFRTPSDDGSHKYTVELNVGEDGEPSVPYVVVDVPRKALAFYQNSYASEVHIEGAFRHEMMIPDAMFPEAWKNVVA